MIGQEIAANWKLTELFFEHILTIINLLTMFNYPCKKFVLFQTNINSTQYEDMADQQGPPDSHEAMNNRDFSRPREKRSFEFLVGLINNNSKYEVIRSDPELRNTNVGLSRVRFSLYLTLSLII